MGDLVRLTENIQKHLNELFDERYTLELQFRRMRDDMLRMKHDLSKIDNEILYLRKKLRQARGEPDEWDI